MLTTPRWLRVGFRAVLLIGGLALVLLPLLSRSPVPVPWVAFAVLVGALTLAAGAWPKPWNRFDLFVATPEGIAFPANDLLVAGMGRSDDRRWLLVLWTNIAHVRLATVRGEPSPCVAFDVRVSPEERAAFFARVDSPADRTGRTGPDVFAAFDINPPHPKKTVARLLSLSGRSEA